MRDAEVEEYGINIGGKRISNLRYADDTALCTRNHENRMKLLNAINEKGLERNMKLNAKKTKVMHIGKADFKPVIIEGEELEKVHDFRYLGSINQIAAIVPKTSPQELQWQKQKHLT